MKDRALGACPITRRVVRNETDRVIHISSEHRLEHDQLIEALDIAESIESLKDKHKVYQAFLDYMYNGEGILSALKQSVNSLVVHGIYKARGMFFENDKVHKLLVDAGQSCAQTTAYNCGLYDFAQDRTFKTLDEMFTNDMTELVNDKRLGKQIISTCISPRMGKEWVKAATGAMLLFDPAIKPKFAETYPTNEA